jgi:hypothetical protein
LADLLFIRPADDAAAVVSSLIGDRLRRWVENGVNGIPRLSVKDLAGSVNATRVHVDSEFKFGHRHLFFFGHGIKPALVAGGVALVDDANIIWLPTDAVVVAVACYSLEGLGRSATASGTVAGYLGWSDQLPIPQLNPGPMITALCDGLVPLLQGADLEATKNELQARFVDAHEEYQRWSPPEGLALLFAKMAASYASFCVGIEGRVNSTL